MSKTVTPVEANKSLAKKKKKSNNNNLKENLGNVISIRVFNNL